jgi:hypothetical protein
MQMDTPENGWRDTRAAAPDEPPVRLLDKLRADLARAEQALRDLEYADDLCHVTGSWDRARALVQTIQREIAEAERASA